MLARTLSRQGSSTHEMSKPAAVERRGKMPRPLEPPGLLVSADGLRGFQHAVTYLQGEDVVHDAIRDVLLARAAPAHVAVVLRRLGAVSEEARDTSVRYLFCL